MTFYKIWHRTCVNPFNNHNSLSANRKKKPDSNQRPFFTAEEHTVTFLNLSFREFLLSELLRMHGMTNFKIVAAQQTRFV
jgi:hypothetical protein